MERGANRYPRQAKWRLLQNWPRHRPRLTRPKPSRLKDENEQRAADAERRDISRTPSQQLSEASQVTALTESAEQPTAPDPTEAIQIKDENEQHAAEGSRDISGTPSQPLSEARQVAAPAELAEAPTTPDPTEAIQAKDENEQRAADAERRDISGTPSQPLSEARQVTALTESAEQPTAHDPTEAIQIKDENEQHAAEGRDSSGTRSQPLSEASQVAAPAELAEAPTTPDPTEAIQAKDENEQRAADAERRDISRTPSQQLSEARQVTALIESAEQPTAHDPTEAIQIKDENEQHAAERNAATAVERRANRYPRQAESRLLQNWPRRRPRLVRARPSMFKTKMGTVPPMPKAAASVERRARRYPSQAKRRRL